MLWQDITCELHVITCCQWSLHAQLHVHYRHCYLLLHAALINYMNITCCLDPLHVQVHSVIFSHGCCCSWCNRLAGAISALSRSTLWLRFLGQECLECPWCDSTIFKQSCQIQRYNQLDHQTKSWLMRNRSIFWRDEDMEQSHSTWRSHPNRRCVSKFNR